MPFNSKKKKNFNVYLKYYSNTGIYLLVFKIIYARYFYITASSCSCRKSNNKKQQPQNIYNNKKIILC